MKLKDLIAVCDIKQLTIAIAPSYFKKNKALYDLAEKTRRSDAYGSFYRETDNGYITAILTPNTPLLDHNKFLHLYKNDSLMDTFANMTVDHKPTQPRMPPISIGGGIGEQRGENKRIVFNLN